jgi:hypothetical protein
VRFCLLNLSHASPHVTAHIELVWAKDCLVLSLRAESQLQDFETEGCWDTFRWAWGEYGGQLVHAVEQCQPQCRQRPLLPFRCRAERFRPLCDTNTRFCLSSCPADCTDCHSDALLLTTLHTSLQASAISRLCTQLLCFEYCFSTCGHCAASAALYMCG